MRCIVALSLGFAASCDAGALGGSAAGGTSSRYAEQRPEALSENGRLILRAVDEAGVPLAGIDLFAIHNLAWLPEAWADCGNGYPDVDQHNVHLRTDGTGRIELQLAADWALRTDARGLSSVLHLADAANAERANLGAVVPIARLSPSLPNDLGEVVLRPRRLLAAGRLLGTDHPRSRPKVVLRVPWHEPLTHYERPLDSVPPIADRLLALDLVQTWNGTSTVFRFEGWLPGEELVLSYATRPFEPFEFLGPIEPGRHDLVLTPPALR